MGTSTSKYLRKQKMTKEQKSRFNKQIKRLENKRKGKNSQSQV